MAIPNRPQVHPIQEADLRQTRASIAAQLEQPEHWIDVAGARNAVATLDAFLAGEDPTDTLSAAALAAYEDERQRWRNIERAIRRN